MDADVNHWDESIGLVLKVHRVPRFILSASQTDEHHRAERGPVNKNVMAGLQETVSTNSNHRQRREPASHIDTPKSTAVFFGVPKEEPQSPDVTDHRIYSNPPVGDGVDTRV